MSYRITVEVNYAGIGEVARSDDVRQMVNQAADRIAGAVRASVGPDVPVTVTEYTTDREAAAVTIADRRGLGLQARDGVLTRAASGIGADVRIR
ncbi:hypothetical protein [Micromonospora craniellae]|uniref:Uncharacterized protein n=1 Tax=Micromonospora craniellae TaxID=2294034 RepID=A0A372G203_9ACTN|nr:hypothetical protein [Micromonospora craniellae]QOC89878.1 hypothetical protein ID554_16710 [Micromonospora craniellae]RFS47023.1 hypothetical protein D0Q02_07625 [Micromonospora craniellae]